MNLSWICRDDISVGCCNADLIPVPSCLEHCHRPDAKIRVIEQAEGLRSELKLKCFRSKGQVLEVGEVKTVEGGPRRVLRPQLPSSPGSGESVKHCVRT